MAHHAVGIIPARSRDQVSLVNVHILCACSSGPSRTLIRAQGTPAALRDPSARHSRLELTELDVLLWVSSS